MSTDKEMKIEFAPGCFDSFEGTQEELDGLIAEIQRLVDTGEIFEKSRAIDLDDLDDEDMEMLERFAELEDKRNTRPIQ